MIGLRRMPGPNDQDGKVLYRVLMIEKDTFYEDVLACLGASREVRVHVAHRLVLKSIAAALLPPELDDDFYVSDDPEVIQAKQDYAAFLTAAWGVLSRLMPIDAVVSANFGYCAEREFAGALEALGVPFLALHKENLKSPGRMDFFYPVVPDPAATSAGPNTWMMLSDSCPGTSCFATATWRFLVWPRSARM